MRPHVILHNAVSLDGYVTGFDVDLALYYELVSTWNEDATLVGCDTLLTGLAAERIEPDTDEVSDRMHNRSAGDSGDTRPLLVVPDSRGRLRSWGYLMEQPYWRGGIALCSAATPSEHLEYLEGYHIDRITVGADHADLGKALNELAARFSVKRIRVDSGGVLNGLLLRLGLVDEISMLIHPILVGNPALTPVYRAPDWTSPTSNIRLEHNRTEMLRDGLVWQRYAVRH